jgi:hypothetical protein
MENGLGTMDHGYIKTLFIADIVRAAREAPKEKGKTCLN